MDGQQKSTFREGTYATHAYAKDPESRCVQQTEQAAERQFDDVLSLLRYRYMYMYMYMYMYRRSRDVYL